MIRRRILNVVYTTHNGMQLDVRRLNKINDVRYVCACVRKDKTIIKWGEKRRGERKIRDRSGRGGGTYIYKRYDQTLGSIKKKEVNTRSK